MHKIDMCRDVCQDVRYGDRIRPVIPFVISVKTELIVWIFRCTLMDKRESSRQNLFFGTVTMPDTNNTAETGNSGNLNLSFIHPGYLSGILGPVLI